MGKIRLTREGATHLAARLSALDNSVGYCVDEITIETVSNEPADFDEFEIEYHIEYDETADYEG